MGWKACNFSTKELFGRVITRIHTNYGEDTMPQKGDEYGVSRLCFETESGERYRMMHHQDCCESVYLHEWDGDWTDLLGVVIFAEESESAKDYGEDEHWCGTGTWTFYKLWTNKGAMDMRWLGESNGYYSEHVSFEKWHGNLDDFEWGEDY